MVLLIWREKRLYLSLDIRDKTMPDIIEEKVKKRNISAKKPMFVDTRKNYLTERRPSEDGGEFLLGFLSRGYPSPKF